MINLAAVLTAALVLVSADDLSAGRGLSCDTAQQVADYLELSDGDTDNQRAAIEAVNNGAGHPYACVVWDMLLKKGPVAKTVTVHGKVWNVTEIEIVALQDPMTGEWRGIEPSKQFIGIPAPGTGI